MAIDNNGKEYLSVKEFNDMKADRFPVSRRYAKIWYGRPCFGEADYFIDQVKFACKLDKK